MVSTIKWQVQSARLTTFFSGGETPDAAGFWSEVVGNAPVEEHKASGRFQQIGSFDGWQIQLSSLPGRLDWTINLEPQSRESSEYLRVALGGSFESAFSTLGKISAKWLEICPPTNRLALGTILIQPVEDRRSGYIQLTEYLPGVEIDPDNSIDFHYQINRPRDSKVVPGIMVNRLTKWVVIRTGLLLIAMRPGGGNLVQSAMEDEMSAMQLELDINTSESRKDDLPKSDLISSFNELVELGKEIANKGDVK